MTGIGRIARGPGDGWRGDCDSIRDMGWIGLNRLIFGKIFFVVIIAFECNYKETDPEWSSDGLCGSGSISGKIDVDLKMSELCD